MSRRQNPEEFLWPEMVASIRREPLPRWEDGAPQECDQTDHADLPRTVGSNGSNNWGPMAAMVRYFRSTGEPLRQLWMAFFETSWLRWMGRELDSTTYDSFHVCSVLGTAARADAYRHHDVAAAARKWLSVYAARALARYDEKAGRVLAIGQRSAGHDDDRYFADDFLRVGRGWDPPAKWENDSRDKAFLWLYRDIVREVVRPFISGVDPINWLWDSGVEFMAALGIFEAEEGKAAWHEPGSIHGATQPVPIAVATRGTIRFAPARRGANDARLHRKAGACAVTRVPGALVYTSSVFADETIPFPGGAVIRDTRIGGKAREDDDNQAPQPLPAPPPSTGPENKPSWIERMGL